MARKDKPCFFRSRTTGDSSLARASASALKRFARSTPVTPSRTPRRLAAASAALVLAEIARASSCATAEISIQSVHEIDHLVEGLQGLRQKLNNDGDRLSSDRATCDVWPVDD